MGAAVDRDGADPFTPLRAVTEVFAAFPRPWSIGGGWALDLFLRRVTRGHEDIDVVVLRRDQRDLGTLLSGWDLEKVVPGPPGRKEPWSGTDLLALPVHEVHAHRTSETLRAVEILLNEADGDLWRFRRNLAITRPLARTFGRSRAGIPFLAPEIVLLYKAKEPRPVDEQDFLAVVPLLEDEPRTWLCTALMTCHPGHPWIQRLV